MRKKRATAKSKTVTPAHDTVSSKAPSDKDFPIVGIGASAGGLAAFEAFFSGMPADADPGMAFVLVQHLAPDHKSILTELIQRYTRMKVFEVTDGITVQPNCAYIIPPNRNMAFMNGALQLLEPVEPRGQRLPIDFFFRSLARDQHERAIGIVLAGTGSDGTQGVRDIKGEGGMAMAQSPESTDYDGMPRSAMATGLVDYVLPPTRMAAQLIAFAARAFGKAPRPDGLPTPRVEDAMKKVFLLVRTQTGHDFSLYKQSTIHRRVERRMAVHQIELLDEYVRYLQRTPSEVAALFQDLLIGVTSFFRDPEAFKALESHLVTDLVKPKPSGSLLRVWVPGCSTGEEAYSIAILLHEAEQAARKTFKVQVFATDIDSRSIDTARAGVYPSSILPDVPPERLSRFFVQDSNGGSYRIHKSIRDMMVFSEQNVIKDPPFSRLDLISCRNLLIYMGGELQKKLMPLFHYALNPGGTLFLGTSETVGDFADLFSALDRKAKLYRRKDDLRGTARVALGRYFPPATPDRILLRPPRKPPADGKTRLRELTEKALLQKYAPVGALVDENGDILYLHGRTGLYLEPAPGEAGVNILKMAREGLRHDLTSALHQAVARREPVRCDGVRVKTNGSFTTVHLTVHPVEAGPEAPAGQSLFLIILEESPASGRKQRAPATVDEGPRDAHVARLKKELKAKEEYLQSANEELETSNEELKSSNEEMQSVNEELQSTNEELETSKEELQSVNEELATVNAELQTKVADLSRVNNDMNNLLAGTDIGMVFVDHQLRIMRFTPAVTQLINLIPTDVGRPVGHIVSNMAGYNRLVEDVKTVLDTLIPKEVEVQTRTGAWHLLRIRPYRTLENVIEGAVITFTEITETKKARAALHDAETLRRLAMVLRDAQDAVVVHDLEGRILAWNPAATRLYGWTEAEALAMNIRNLTPEAQRKEAVATTRRLARYESLEPFHAQRVTKDNRILEVWLTATGLVNETGDVYAVATTEREIHGPEGRAMK